jgi:hypothetical protein
VSPGPQKEVLQEGNDPRLVLDFTLEEADMLLSPLEPNNKRVATPRGPSMHQGGRSPTQPTDSPNPPRPTQAITTNHSNPLSNLGLSGLIVSTAIERRAAIHRPGVSNRTIDESETPGKDNGLR